MGGGPGLLVLLISALALSCHGQLTRKSSLRTRKLPDLDVCGQNKQTFDVKIIDGKPAELGTYPWMANIGYSRRPNGGDIDWKCAGSLITDQYVITAAHCVYPALLRRGKDRLYVKRVRLGELDLNPNVEDYATPTDFDVDKITWHEEYSDETKENDIALIKLKGKATFTDLIKPICLPPPEFQQNLFVGFSPVVAGWGRTSLERNAPLDTRLLQAEVEIQETAECRRNVTAAPASRPNAPPPLANVVIDHRVICAGSPGKDACQGDSGGPLMLLREIKRGASDSVNIFLMGIVSYGHSCAAEGYPGVYTRVSEFMRWLLDNMDI